MTAQLWPQSILSCKPVLVATLNEPIPLRILAQDGRTDLFPQVRIYNSSTLQIAALSGVHFAEGLYTIDWTPTIEGYYTMVGEFYFDSLHTTSANYEKVADDIEVNTVKTSITRLLGLQHENTVIDQQAYLGDGNLLSARVRLYDSKPNAMAAGGTGVVAAYTVAATYDVNGRLDSYRMVRDA